LNYFFSNSKSSLNNQESAEVIRKVYNYQTGKIELELQDGNFIETTEQVVPPKLELTDSTFPDDFLKIVDLQKYRDIKIDKIL
jgi:hypothetical protein